MNKFLTKIAGLFLGMAMAIGVGVAVGSNADIFNPTYATAVTGSGTGSLGFNSDHKVSKSGDTISDTKSATWAFTTDGGYIALDGGSIHTGSTNKTCSHQTWTTGDYSGVKITSVVINAKMAADSSVFVSATINGNNIETAKSITATAADYTFTNNDNYTGGNLIVKAYRGSATKKAIYVYSITVNYVELETYAVSFDVNTEGYGTVNQSSITGVPSGASITTSNNTITINGTTVTATPTTSTSQYTYAFTGWSNNTGTVTADRTITANFSKTTNTFTVGGTINNGSLSSTESIEYGNALNINLNPASGHKLPSTLTSVFMGDDELVAGTGYTYNNSTGAISIVSVTGNVVINATCPIDATTHTISGSITNGSLTGDTGEKVAGDDYIVQIAPTALYKYPTSIEVTGAGEENTGWAYDSSDGAVYIYGLSANVTVTATCPAASITSISVSEQKTAFTLGDEFSFGGTVKANYDDAAGTTNQTISNDLVDINSEAYDAFVESNSITIYVVLKANNSISTSYTVSVARKTIPVNTTYVKVTASQSDWSGKYVFMNSNNGYVMGTAISSDRVANGTLTDIKNTSGNKIGSSDTVIASGYANYVYTITKAGDYYTISPDTGDNAGKFLAGTGVKNKAQFLENSNTTDYRLWTISYNNGFVIENKGNKADSVNSILRCNDSNGWAAYSSTQATNGAPCLFVKTETQAGTKSLIKISATGPADYAKKEDDILTAADFTVTALYDTAESATVSDNVTIVSGATLVAGSNTVTLSYTEGGVTKTCKVTVIADENTATLDGIVWSQENVVRTVFDGSAIGSFGALQKHYNDGSKIALSLSDCAVAVYSDTSGTKAHDIVAPTSYTWDVDNDNGKYLGVTYEGYTLYSGVVNVVKNINDVYEQVPTYAWSKVTSINDGDVVTFVGESDKKVASGMGNNVIDVASYSSSVSTSFYFTVGKVVANNKTYYTFHNEDGYLGNHSTGTSSNNNAYLDDAIDTSNNKNYFTVSFDDGDVIITSVYDNNRTLQLRKGTPDRFCFYGSAQTPIQLYKGNASFVPSGNNIANTNAVAQKAALDYVDYFNTTMACVNDGSTANVSSKWTTVSERFATVLTSLKSDADALANFKALFAYAYARGSDKYDDADELQDMLAKYNHILKAYEVDDFLNDDPINRPTAKYTNVGNSLTGYLFDEENSSALIVLVTSILGAAAIGGYFFLRKRKED